VQPCEGLGNSRVSETLLVNRYRLDEELGRGGMGIVYRGHDTVLDRPVAIKVLTTAGLGSEGKNRLLNEAQAAARLNHPNIVSVHDAGEAGGTPFIIMELVEGRLLRDLVSLPEGSSPAPLPETIAFLRQVCAALEHAHRHGIIHRDLKPENVVITHNQTVKLMDFGLARLAGASRLTEEGAIVGTFAYLAPEVMLGESASIHSDLYALGVILYELTAGRPPFIGDTLMAVASQHLNAPVVPPSTYNLEIPAALDSLAVRLLAKRPEERPASAAEVRQTLERLDSPESTTPTEEIPLLDRIARGQIVGRERELGEAKTLWRRAAGGEGHTLLVSGEPGIGKTRFVRELIANAEIHRATALVGECYAEGGAPYAPVAQIIRDVLGQSAALPVLPNYVLADLITLAPDLRQRYPDVPPNPPLEDSQAQQQRLFDSFAAFCSELSGRAPLFLLVDDVHWADSGTLLLLRSLARRARKMRLLLVLTYREVELGEARTLNDMLFDLNRERLATRFKLARLSRQETGALLQAMFAEVVTQVFVDAIYHETEGNPFFIEEVCKALIEDGQVYREGSHWQRLSMEEIRIPQSVRVAISSRLEKMPDSVQDVLRLAAVFGREFDFDALRRASELDEDSLIAALESAERAQLIGEVRRPGQAGTLFAFAHALIPTTLRDGMSSLRRQRLHRRVAQAIAALRPADFEVLAHHYGQAGDAEQARAYYAQAGERMLALYANQEAERHFQAALEIEGIPAADKAHLLGGLGLAQVRQSRFEPAIRNWLEAIRLYQELGETETVARLYARAARAASHGGDTPRSLELCRAGLAALNTAGMPESAGLAALLHEAARTCHFSGLPEESIAYAQQALAMAGRLNVVEVKAEALITVAMVSPIPHSEELAMLREAIQLAEPAGMLLAAMRAYNNLANALEQMGELPSARDYYQQAAELARRRGGAAEELFVAAQAAEMTLALGDFEAVAGQLPDLKQLRAIAGEDAAGSNSLSRTEGLLFRYRGQWDKGVTALREYQQRSRQRGDLQQLWIANETLAEALLDHNRLAEAEEALLEGLAISERGLGSGVVTRCLLATTYARQGKTAEAEQQLAAARKEAGPHPALPHREYLYLAEGEVHKSAGRWTEAIAAYTGAAESQARMRKRWYQAMTLQLIAGVHLARANADDEQQAQLLMDKSRRILRELNIRPAALKVSPEHW
jgi:tetratricopeptide (TPR) repeat protein